MSKAMSDKLTEKLFPKHWVQERVRRLEDKAPDMTSYSMFTQMNNIVNYQAEQIAALQAELERFCWVRVSTPAGSK